MAGAIRAADGTRLAYDDEGSGAPVVLLHGLGSSRAKWTAVADALVAEGLRVVRLDLRGAGESETPERPYDVATLAADLAALADAVGLERFHLAGHSLGGMIAQRFAVDRPERVRSLVLLSTTSHNGRRATEFSRAMATIAERGFDAVERDPELRATVERILAEAFPAAPLPVEMFKKGLEQPNRELAWAWGATAGFSVKDELATIRCPVLVAHGTADALIPFGAGRLLHEAIAGSTFLPIDGAGHSLASRHADLVARAIAEHVRAADRV
jgi:pimeloyl-ACP methyl ester carboxylesterase